MCVHAPTCQMRYVQASRVGPPCSLRRAWRSLNAAQAAQQLLHEQQVVLPALVWQHHINSFAQAHALAQLWVQLLLQAPGCLRQVGQLSAREQHLQQGAAALPSEQYACDGRHQTHFCSMLLPLLAAASLN